MMQAVIIDDEPKSRNLLSELIENRFPDIGISGLAANGKEGIQLIKQVHPDVVFLDINMPGMNGFDMLRELQPVNFDTIFITAYDQFAVKAFQYNAFDYLLKPVDLDEFTHCIERLREKKTKADFQLRLESLLSKLEHPNKLPDRITIHSMDGITIIPISDIIYIEAAGAYSIFYWKGQNKVISSVNLKQYEELLEVHNFFRVHNSFLINMAQVKKFLKEDGGCVVMSDDSKVMVSKRRKDEFLKRLGG